VRGATVKRFLEVARFEFVYQLRRWSTLLYATVFAVLAYLATRQLVVDAREAEAYFNSPVMIGAAAVIMSLISLLIVAAVAGDAATRDGHARIEPLLHTTPVSKLAYLGGRYVGALAVTALLLLIVPIGLAVAPVLSGVEPELVGPFRLRAYVDAYLLVALPNVVTATALLFALAVFARHAGASYAGALVLFVSAMLSREFVAGVLNRWELAKYTDFSSFVVLNQLYRQWAPAQMNVELVGLRNGLLWNRLLWLGAAAVVGALAYFRFRFAHEAESRRLPLLRRLLRRAPWRRASAKAAPAPAAEELGPGAPVAVPRPPRSFGAGTRLQQVLAYLRDSVGAILRNRMLLVLPVFLGVMVLLGPELMEHLGVPYLPTTDRFIRVIGVYSEMELLLGIMVPFLVVFLAGELLWRERDARVDSLTGAAPVPDWVPLTGRGLALALAVGGMLALLIVTGVIVQARGGWWDFEPGLYARVFLGLLLIDYLLFAVLALAIHVLVNQKYVGHTIAVLAWFFTVFAPGMGVEHKLLVYGSDPGWTYTRMAGFGPFMGPLLWFKLYWGGWALLLAVAARLFWVRGADQRPMDRLRLARRRFRGRLAATAAGAVLLVLVTGGFVFWNTNVLNGYASSEDLNARAAEYERRYGGFEGAPHPSITATRVELELYPERRAFEATGEYTLVNRTAQPIDTLHFALETAAQTDPLAFDRPARAALTDDRLGHHVYVLDQPVAPGDSLRARWRVRYEPRGFAHDGMQTHIGENGTYFESGDWLPNIGYQAGRELSNASLRRELGLPERAPAPRLEDEAARLHTAHADQVDFEAVIGTAAGQVAVAPGRLMRSWMEGRRAYFQFGTDAPIRNGWAVFSARYEVARAEAGAVDLRVYHTPGHDHNVDRFLRALEVSVTDYARRFGPYPHGQLALVEFPGYASFLRAHPITISYWEGFGLLAPERDPREIALPFAVVAHEVAHQWWGGRLAPAMVEGGGVLSESLAWYSALGVVEREFGSAHLQRLLAMFRESYIGPRPLADVPLLRARDFIGMYRRGPFAMYALREYVGEAPVDRALRTLIDRHGGGEPPLPTSLDLYAELRSVAPDSLHGMLADLFERNTYWSLSVDSVRTDSLPGGAWRVELDVTARKFAVDTAAVETDLEMNDPIEIGIYEGELRRANVEVEPGRAPTGTLGVTTGAPLYRGFHRLRTGTQTLTVTVPERPGSVGVDPRRLLMEIEAADNYREIED